MDAMLRKLDQALRQWLVCSVGSGIPTRSTQMPGLASPGIFTHPSAAWTEMTQRLGSPGPGAPASGSSVQLWLSLSLTASGGAGFLHGAPTVSCKGGRCMAFYGPVSEVTQESFHQFLLEQSQACPTTKGGHRAPPPEGSIYKEFVAIYISHWFWV